MAVSPWRIARSRAVGSRTPRSSRAVTPSSGIFSEAAADLEDGRSAPHAIEQHSHGVRVTVPGGRLKRLIQILRPGQLEQQLDAVRTSGPDGEIDRQPGGLRASIDEETHLRGISGRGRPGEHRLVLQRGSMFEQQLQHIDRPNLAAASTRGV